MRKAKEIIFPLKKLISRDAEHNISMHQISTELNIAKTTVGAILKKYRETGSIKNKPRPADRRPAKNNK